MSEHVTIFKSVLKDLHLALQSEDCTIDECGTALLWAEERIALLEKACEAAQAVRQSLVSYPDFLTLHITLPKLETALRAAEYLEEKIDE